MEKEKLLEDIYEAIQSFEEERALDTVKMSIEAGIDPSEIIEKGIAKGLKIVGEPFTNELYGVAIKKGENWLKSQIDEVIASGILESLEDTWF